MSRVSIYEDRQGKDRDKAGTGVKDRNGQDRDDEAEADNNGVKVYDDSDCREVHAAEKRYEERLRRGETQDHEKTRGPIGIIDPATGNVTDRFQNPALLTLLLCAVESNHNPWI